MISTSFYKFIVLKNLKNLKSEILNFMKKNLIKGKILLAKEGINGAFTCESKKINTNFQNFLNSKLNTTLLFKSQKSIKHYFKRTLVKIRKEIITFKKDYDIKNTGKYLKPKKLNSWYKNNKDFVIIDHRNNYEFDVGHFKNSIKLNIEKFTNFPKEIKKLKEKIKNKKIVNFCTGGIRCEKSTAWMKENGFGNKIYQIEGGIIGYGKECGDEFWDGKLFVFDERGAVNIDEKKQKKIEGKLTQCKICYLPETLKHKCKVTKKEFIMCKKCHILMNGCFNKMIRNQYLEKLC